MLKCFVWVKIECPNRTSSHVMLQKISPRRTHKLSYITLSADCVSTSSDIWGRDTLPGNAFVCYTFKKIKSKKIAPVIDATQLTLNICLQSVLYNNTYTYSYIVAWNVLLSGWLSTARPGLRVVSNHSRFLSLYCCTCCKYNPPTHLCTHTHVYVRLSLMLG